MMFTLHFGEEAEKDTYKIKNCQHRIGFPFNFIINK